MLETGLRTRPEGGRDKLESWRRKQSLSRERWMREEVGDGEARAEEMGPGTGDKSLGV